MAEWVDQGEASKKSLISFAFFGSPTITPERLNGKNYLYWYNVVEVWFLGQGLSEHLTKKTDEIDVAKRD